MQAVEAVRNIDVSGLGFVGLLNLVLSLLSLGVRAFAFADSLIRPAQAYPAAGKLTKLAWCAILGVGLLLGLAIPGLIGLFNLAGLIAAILYLVDVRPALREVGKPGRNNQGPYGSW